MTLKMVTIWKNVSFSFDDLFRLSLLNRFEIIWNMKLSVFKYIIFEIYSFKTLTFVKNCEKKMILKYFDFIISFA